MRAIVCCVMLVVPSTACFAKGPWRSVIQRTTNDRDHDLIKALLTRQRFDEAEQICRDEYAQLDPKSDAAARWAIRQSVVLSAQQLTTKTFSQSDIQRAQKPVSDLLKSYPEHRRALFLKAQLADVEKSAAWHEVVIVSISPPDDQRTESAMKRLANTTRALGELAEQSQLTVAKLSGTGTSLSDKAIASDTKRLQYELQADIVSMALMQTELFAPGSRDRISAAVKAKNSADDTLRDMPDASVARQAIERMRIDALLRGGDYANAERSLVELARSMNGVVSPRVLALQIQLELLQNRDAIAAKRLAGFFGGDPENATRSIEMDLVRLEHLVRKNDTDVGSWLESIERRHGAYARRRAEALSLTKLRSGSSVSAVDPSIVAAQGQEWLRRNDPERAAKLLAAAAQAERDPDRAIVRASEAAAAYVKADQAEAAADILRSVSLDNRQANKASAAHLQAAVLLSSSKLADAAAKVEQLLRATHREWPTSEAAASARKWLLTLLDRQSRKLDAAVAATQFLSASTAPAKVDETLSRWSDLIRQSRSEETELLIMQFQTAAAAKLELPNVANRYPFTACFLVEQNSLANLPTKLTGEAGSDPFTNAFLQFRRDQSVEPVLLKPPTELIDLANWRLMRDAKLNARVRQSVADLTKDWGAGSVGNQATLLVWRDRRDEAMALIQRMTKDSPNAAALWRDFAVALAGTGKREDQTMAVTVWERLSNGLPKGSDAWHEAKIAAIELLLQTGETEEAARRSKYILLTDSPADPKLRERYEAAANR